jgi:excisionase family DNA binding protein
MAQDEAITIAEAAAALGVQKPRVHQMLQAGTLTGPATGPGRAPRNAPRVWRAALDEELARRRDEQAQPQPAHAKVSKRPARKEAVQDGDARAVRDAAQQMKIALDQARDALRAERAQTRQVTQVLAQTVAMLQEQQRLAEQADTVADGYAAAVTQLLTPPDPTGL